DRQQGDDGEKGQQEIESAGGPLGAYGDLGERRAIERVLTGVGPGTPVQASGVAIGALQQGLHPSHHRVVRGWVARRSEVARPVTVDEWPRCRWECDRSTPVAAANFARSMPADNFLNCM